MDKDGFIGFVGDDECVVVVELFVYEFESDVCVEYDAVFGCVAAVFRVSGGVVRDDAVGYEPVGLFGLSTGILLECGSDQMYSVSVGNCDECIAFSLLCRM